MFRSDTGIKCYMDLLTNVVASWAMTGQIALLDWVRSRSSLSAPMETKQGQAVWETWWLVPSQDRYINRRNIHASPVKTCMTLNQGNFGCEESPIHGHDALHTDTHRPTLRTSYVIQTEDAVFVLGWLHPSTSVTKQVVPRATLMSFLLASTEH